MNSYLEAITALGSGSLHPGGFSHTIELLSKFSISPDDIILDIGCGTGRTACHLAKTYRAHVFALDNSEKMLSKARVRAGQEGADVHFVLGDVLDLPFMDETIDMILVESVLIFLPVQKALRECHRVLKRKGILADVELMASGSLPAGAAERIRNVCGLPQTPSLKEWIEHFDCAGFDYAFVKQSRLPGLLGNLKEMFYKDPCQMVSKEMADNKELGNVLWKYRGLMLRNFRHLGFGTFIMKKA